MKYNLPDVKHQKKYILNSSLMKRREGQICNFTYVTIREKEVDSVTLAKQKHSRSIKVFRNRILT